MTSNRFLNRINGITTASAFLLLRGLLFTLLPYSAFLGFGDQINFYRLAQLPGWPFFNYWVEFPPVFPFLSAGLYRMAGGNELIYCYSFAAIITLFDSASILIFWKLIQRLDAEYPAKIKLICYAAILCFFPYGWWYFDPFAVFFFLLSLWCVLTQKPLASGLSIAAGFLWKVFPMLAIIAAWNLQKKRNFIEVLCISFLAIGLTLGALWLASPEMTSASLAAQYSKGSWQTPWALLDGNPGTGNFGPLTDRWTPALAFQSQRNVARIPAIIPLITAGLIGIFLIKKANPHTDLHRIAMVGAGWTLLILASPGWSPQWILFILPIILLTFPTGKAIWTISLLICLSLTEWPVLFSRGRVDLIWMIIGIRTVFMILLFALFASQAIKPTINLKQTTEIA